MSINQKQELGFFEKSFMFRMIRDFFLLLVIVAGLELAVRYVMIMYDFKYNEPQRIQRIAVSLSNDIRSIMLNAGGPTAARTIYPIIDKNYDDMGLTVAVSPSQITIDSILISQNMEALGLVQDWPNAHHTEAKVSISAEQYCLGCHIKANIGDILGTVQVRSYFDRKVDHWLSEVKMTAGVLSINILIHTLVLFLLLKIRMQPLLALRSTVSSLARGLVDISPRTFVKSEDEFGDLAIDLNHFLDRITLVIKDLDIILSEVLTVGDRLNVLTKSLEKQCSEMREMFFPTNDNKSSEKNIALRLTAAKESGVVEILDQSFVELLNSSEIKELDREKLKVILEKLRNSFESLNKSISSVSSRKVLDKESLDSYDLFVNSLKEMALLEASMKRVVGTGQETLRRIVPKK
jgi:methyl-accepting chemotaxis protein